jgi:chromate transporter
VQGMTAAVKPIVAVMLLAIAYDFAKKSWQGQGWLITLALAVVSLIAFEWLGVHPAIVIGALLLYALVDPRGKKGTDKKKQAEGGSR